MRLAIIEVEFVADVMWGDDVVLLSMDTAGAGTLITALNRCARTGSAQLIDNARLYSFQIEPGAAHLDVSGRRCVCRLDPGKVVELVDRLRVLQRTDRADIRGIDIAAPADTLLLWRRRSAYSGAAIGEAPSSGGWVRTDDASTARNELSANIIGEMPRNRL